MLEGRLKLPFFTFSKVSWTVGHSKGGEPINKANNMQPNDQRSLERP